MHKIRTIALAATAALAVAGTATALTGPSTAAPTSGPARGYVVLLNQGASVDAAVADLRASGAKVTNVNRAVGLLTVTSTDTNFRATGAAATGVQGVAADVSIGSVPDQKPDLVETEAIRAANAGTAKAPSPAKTPTGDPLDTYLWGMRMIGADQAHAIDRGSKHVKVGVIDTGVQGDVPDLAPNFDWKLSRNFVTDIPEIDGECEYAGCVDPVGVDNGGHGTHVAGTIAAALNGSGLSGVAPNVDLVEVRAGQDSGYFFLAPSVDALTYAGDAGLDVVNMSYYVDPWMYNCPGGAPEDSPEQAADQDLIIEGMNRALDYAHDHGVTLVAALGNNHDDLAHPRTDLTSPDYGGPTYARTIDGTSCLHLPMEGNHVIGTSSVGPSTTKADYSNWTTNPTSGEIEVSAPGGWFRDGYGTPSYRTVGNEILSTYPLAVLQEDGLVDADGNITPGGEASGVMKQCPAKVKPGVAPCGYYVFLQGTSMASPHSTGVAALAVSAHGSWDEDGEEYGMDPSAVAALLASTATDHACPAGGVQDYLREGRSAAFTATCVGDDEFNGMYGAGIVSALGVVAP